MPHDAAMDALHVSLVWQVVNRLANAFGFALLPGQLESGTRSLHRFGYRFPRFLTGAGTGTADGTAPRRAGAPRPHLVAAGGFDRRHRCL